MANTWSTPELRRFGTFAELTQQLTPEQCIIAVADGTKVLSGADGCEIGPEGATVPIGSP